MICLAQESHNSAMTGSQPHSCYLSRGPAKPVSQLALLCGLSVPGSGLLTSVQLDDYIGHGCEYSHPFQDVYIP